MLIKSSIPASTVLLSKNGECLVLDPAASICWRGTSWFYRGDANITTLEGMVWLGDGLTDTVMLKRKSWYFPYNQEL